MRRLVFSSILAVGLLGLLAAPALAGARTIVVAPSGGNDSAAIQAAFATAGPGGTVQLTAGTFTVNSTIYVQRFTGSFKGAGEKLTTIDMTGTGTVGLTADKQGSQVEPFPFLIGFGGGSPSVSGMSVDIQSTSPAASWDDWWIGGPADSLETVFLVTGGAGAWFDRVAVTAGTGNDGDGYNAQAAVYITGTQQVGEYAFPDVWPQTGGSDRITRCAFSGDFGVWAWGLSHGALTVGGCAADQNTFNDLYFGCWMTDNSNSDVVISHNRLQASYGGGVGLQQGFGAPLTPLVPLPAPRYLVSGNTMLATGEANFMWIEDDSQFYSAPDRLSATVVGNSADMQEDPTGPVVDAAIDGWFASGIKVLDNRIWGTALVGVDVGTEWDTTYFPTFGTAGGWQIVGNDFSGLSPVNPYVSGTAPDVWLGDLASHCLVAGGPRSTTVLDQGTSDTLIDVTPVSDPPAAAAVKALMAPAGARAFKVVKRSGVK